MIEVKFVREKQQAIHKLWIVFEMNWDRLKYAQHVKNDVINQTFEK